MRKRLFLCVVMILTVLTVFACQNTTTTTTTVESSDSTTTTTTTTDSTTSSIDSTTITSILDFTEETFQAMTSLEVAYYMGNGTNLGNTMEAYGRTEIGFDAEVSAYETIWGQPITTEAMIQGMKESGFDTLRIPVAWTNTMDLDNGNYTINQAYLDRVAEIVTYALDAGMFVIVNDHWDGGWWGMFGSADPLVQAEAWELYESMWTQIGTHFKDYSYRLIFESANEELGSRLNDAINEVNGVLTENECYTMANAINQKFVEVIRGLGGKNADRFLLIAGYNTDIDKTVDNRFQMPTDTASNKLLLSVHYYTPWTYCGSSGDASWGTENHYNTQNELLEKMTKFTEMGYGVVFGEYAVLTRSDGSLKNNTIEFITNFLDNSDLYGYVPVLWDTNAFFKKDALEIVDSELATLFQNRSYQVQSAFSMEQIQNFAQLSMAEALAVAIENDLNNPDGPIIVGDEIAIAWIMYTSNDWGVTYSVGDAYDPTLATAGIVATDVIIEEAGTYTIALDFTGIETGYATSTAFSAIGISNGELLFPGYLIQITEILINGTHYALTGIPYTTSDDGVCTRVNLYNQWVSQVPDEARVLIPIQKPYASAVVIDRTEWTEIYTIQITFNYINPNPDN